MCACSLLHFSRSTYEILIIPALSCFCYFYLRVWSFSDVLSNRSVSVIVEAFDIILVSLLLKILCMQLTV